MKKYFLPFFFLLVLSSAGAQEQYVEVVVTDTMIVEPQEWNYFLLIQKRGEEGDGAAKQNGKTVKGPQQKETSAGQTTIDTLKALATSLGGTITGDAESPINFTMTPKSFFGNKEPQFLSIRFTSRQAIESFIRATNKRGDIEGRITGVTHPDMPPFTDRLHARLVDKAKQRAGKLAELSGRRIGSIILITEVAEPEKNMYQGLFEKMLDADRSSWLPGWNAQSADYPTDRLKLEKTLRLRFAWQ